MTFDFLRALNLYYKGARSEGIEKYHVPKKISYPPNIWTVDGLISLNLMVPVNLTLDP
jgi:hypothetical protein